MVRDAKQKSATWYSVIVMYLVRPGGGRSVNDYNYSNVVCACLYLPSADYGAEYMIAVIMRFGCLCRNKIDTVH